MGAIVILTTLLATVFGSISGVGGGVLIKPVMDAVLSLPTSAISFMSGTTVLTMTASSLIRSRKEKFDRRTIPLATGGAFGGLAGKYFFDYAVSNMNTYQVSLVQNYIMVFLTVLVLLYTIFKEKIFSFSLKNRFVTLSSGFLLGVLSSFLGIGGGPINIMILSFLFSMDSKMAARVSLVIIFFSQTLSLTSTLIQRTVPDVNIPLLLGMMGTAVVGATTGRSLSRRLSNRKVDFLFMGLLSLIILVSIYNVVSFTLKLR